MRNQIAEAQKIASGSGSEQDIAEAKIELEVRMLNHEFCLDGVLNILPGFGEPPGPPEIGVLAE